MSLKAIADFTKDVRLVGGTVLVAVAFVGQLLIAQEVDKRIRPVAESLDQFVTLQRENTANNRWELCMKYATEYAEGPDRRTRCDAEKEWWWKLQFYQDCQKTRTDSETACVRPEPEYSPETRRGHP